MWLSWMWRDAWPEASAAVVVQDWCAIHCLNQENICNNTVAKDPTTPQVCRYNVSVLEATTENKTSSVTTHFKKLTTGNNVFIVSVII